MLGRVPCGLGGWVFWVGVQVFYQYQKKKSVYGIGMGMNLGYRYDKNPNIAIGMK